MTLFAVAAIGLIVGSFTNVLIARVPAGEDWVKGSSHCPKCGHDIAWYDNVPVLSWLWLSRRCRHCKQPISGRYPLVELLVAGLFVGVYLTLGLTIAAVGFAYLACVSVALVFIDIDTQRLPDRLVLPSYLVVGAAVTADALVAGHPGDLLRAGAGLAALGGFYGLMAILYPAGMGLGDVKMAGLLGMAAGHLGWSQLAVGAFLGPLLGGLAVIPGMIAGKIGRKTRVPYGPALIAGAWIGYFAGPAVAGIYVRMFT